MSLLLITVVCILCRLQCIQFTTATKDVLKEYCEEQTFEATCDSDEVVVMKEASYGRMRVGSCLTHSYGLTAGSFGCSASVFEHMDSLCSGQRSCRLNVRDLLVFNPCNKDLRGYLEAHYTCIKVVSPDVNLCRQRTPVNVADALNSGGSALRLQQQPMSDGSLSANAMTPMSGYLSNYVTELTGCGNVESPWRVLALPGQRINFTVFDFGAEGANSAAAAGGTGAASGAGMGSMDMASAAAAGGEAHHGAYVCQVLAVIRDSKGIPIGETVCGSAVRQKHAWLSSTHDVEVRMGKIRRYFLIKYEVVGCPDINVASGTTFTRTYSGAAIGCMNRGDIWRLTCQNNRWVGNYGNCSGDISAQPGVMGGFLHLPFGVNVLIMGIVALLIGFAILVGGLVFVRRRLAAKSSVPPPPARASAGSVDLCYQQKSQLYTDYRVDAVGQVLRHSRPLLTTSHRLMGPAPMIGAQHQGKHPMSASGGSTGPFYSAYRSPERYPSMSSGGTQMCGGDNGQVDPESPRYVEHIYESPTCVRKDYEICSSTTVTNSAMDSGCGSSVTRLQQPPLSSMTAGAVRPDNGPRYGSAYEQQADCGVNSCTADSMQYYEVDLSRGPYHSDHQQQAGSL